MNNATAYYASDHVHFVLDEAAVLGRMTAVDDALGIGRAYGLKLQLYYQSIGQLKKCFAEGQDVTVLSNTSQVFFGVSDQQTAEHVSSRLGESTIVVDSGGTNRGSSTQWNDGQHPSRGGGTSSGSSSNWQLQARRLLKPDEVATLAPGLAITFTPGLPPILTRLIRYFDEPTLTRIRTAKRGTVMASIRSVLSLARSVVVLAGFVGLAVVLSMMVQGVPIDSIGNPPVDETIPAPAAKD